MPSAETWMDLETVIQNEVSWKQKPIYINAYMWTRKVVEMILYAKQK